VSDWLGVPGDVWELLLSVLGVMTIALLVTFHPGQPAEDLDHDDPDDVAARW